MYVRGDGDDQLDGWLPSYFGADYPAQTWTDVMQRDMDGLRVEQFPPPANVDGDAPQEGHEPYTPPPPRRTTPTPTKSPTKSPSQTPTETPSAPPPRPAAPTPPDSCGVRAARRRPPTPHLEPRERRRLAVDNHTKSPRPRRRSRAGTSAGDARGA